MPPKRTYTLTSDEVAAIRQSTGLPSTNSGAFRPPDYPEVDLGYVLGTFDASGKAPLQITILDDAWYETASEVFGALDKYMPAGSLPTS